MALKRKKIGAFLIVIAASLWGFDLVALTPKLYHLPTLTTVFILHATPFGLMLFFIGTQWKHFKKLNTKDWFWLLLAAISGGIIGTLAIVKSLFLVNFQSLSIIGLLQKLQPIFAVLLAYFILKEKIGKKFIFWAVIAIISAYLISFETNTNYLNQGKNNEAILYALIAAIAFGCSTVFGRKISAVLPFQSIVLARYGISSIILGSYILFNDNLINVLKSIELNDWKIILTISATTGSGAMAMYYFGLKYVKANIASICELSSPITAIIFDYVLYGNQLSNIQIISACFLFFSIYKISQLQNKFFKNSKFL